MFLHSCLRLLLAFALLVFLSMIEVLERHFLREFFTSTCLLPAFFELLGLGEQDLFILGVRSSLLLSPLVIEVRFSRIARGGLRSQFFSVICCV